MPGGLYYIKPDRTQLDFDALFVNLPHFKNHKFFKVLYYDYLTFGTKITICFLGDIRVQFKRINKKPWKILQLNHSHSVLDSHRWSLLPFQKMNFWASDSSLAAKFSRHVLDLISIGTFQLLKTGVKLAHCFSMTVAMK